MASKLTDRDAQLELVDVRKETSNPYVHSYMKIHVVYGRKPYPHEMEE